MLRQPSLRPITIGPHSDEDTRSRLPLTKGSREEYVHMLGEELRIQHKCGNWSAQPFSVARRRRFRGRAPSDSRILAQKEGRL